jgi:hypothetical protein
VRGAGGEELAVVAIKRHGARPRPLLGRRRRSKQANDAGDAEPEPVVISRVTIVDAEPFGEEGEAESWLEQVRKPDSADEEVEKALRLANRIVHAHRVAAADPYEGELSRAAAHRIRLGYGSGEQVAEGLWTEARTLPLGSVERTRLDPDRIMAEALNGRRPIFAGDDLVLRARLDLEQGRDGQALLQARAAAEAFAQEGAEQSEQWVERLSGAESDGLEETVVEMERFSRRRMHGGQTPST